MGKWFKVGRRNSMYQVAIHWGGDASVTFYVWRYAARLQWDRRSYGFGWFDGQNAFIRFIRKWWTGWHRWDTDNDY